MKEAINEAGKKVQVSENTPVKTIDGINYILTKADQDEMKAREDQWATKQQERQRSAVISARRKEYGSAESQLEEIAANGLNAWIDRINEVNRRNPL